MSLQIGPSAVPPYSTPPAPRRRGGTSNCDVRATPSSDGPDDGERSPPEETAPRRPPKSGCPSSHSDPGPHHLKYLQSFGTFIN